MKKQKLPQNRRDNKKKWAGLCLSVICLISLAGCRMIKDEMIIVNNPQPPVTEDALSVNAGKVTEEETAETVPTEERELFLQQMTDAIEQQFPGQTFTDMPDSKNTVLPVLLQQSYLISSRASSSGIRYIAGVRITEDNPLEEMTCSDGVRVPGFDFNQFDEGRLLLLEESGSGESGLSYLYDMLHRGESGITYLLEAGKRGVTLIPPADSPFLKVSMVKEGNSVTEYIPLTQAMTEEIRSGETVLTETGRESRIALCESREELPAVWLNSGQSLTEKAQTLAVEKSGFDTFEITDIKDVTAVTLQVELYGEKREETLKNRDDLEILTELLIKASYTEARFDKNYSGKLTLTKIDGSAVTISLDYESGGFMLGNSVSCDLSAEDTKKVVSLFTMLDGWKQYGDKIHMEMEQDSYAADANRLNFKLINNTGEEIHYSLSPVVYKKLKSGKDESWERIDTISGICGTFTPMGEKEISLAVPWKDAYELKGEGIYKLEIQVIPKKDMRFEISDTFWLA